jgi:hypothetical protein
MSYIANGRELELYMHLLVYRAKRLVELRWGEITTVAEALMEKPRLTGPEVRNLLFPKPTKCRPLIRNYSTAERQ